MHVFFQLSIIIFLWCLNVSGGTRENPGYHPCIRDCTGKSPMICHYDFTIENYVTLGKACRFCYPNMTQLLEKPDCQCVFADGFERGIMTINRMIPGPSIQVCKGDTIVVDVHNRLSGQSTAIHWHGIHQNGSQYNDGVPFVTQCPISAGTSFRYRFVADRSGTHFYHSHSNVQILDGLYGNLIVRDAPSEDLGPDLYDEDLPEHALLLSDFMHVLGAERIPGYSFAGYGQFPEAFLVNGLGRYLDLDTGEETKTPYAVFTVERGKRYRFRLINSIGTSCDARLTIDEHPLTIISTDGHDVVPITVDSVVFYSGERFDVIVNANRTPGAYWIQVLSPKGCLPKSVHQLGILQYEGYSTIPTAPKPTYENILPEGKVYVDVCNSDPKRVCVEDLRSRDEASVDVAAAKVDREISLIYEVVSYEPADVFTPGVYSHFLIAPEKNPITSGINGISFKFPTVPLLSQPEDARRAGLCNATTIAKRCSVIDCTCPHVMKFPLGEFVEILLVDFTVATFSQLPHPFHLHGHSFYVMDIGQLEDKREFTEERTLSIWRNYRDRLNGFKNNDTFRPVSKDTILIPHNGYVIIRIKFDNPGFWFFHCHFAYHMAIGMSLIFHVGDYDDLPPLPKNFPKCGNYLP